MKSSIAEIKPYISVLIATLNEEAHIKEVLDSILLQDFDLEQLEILIIDGGSIDKTLNIASQFKENFPRLHILDNPRKLSASGWNIGLEHATAPVVSILSGHVILPSAYIKIMLQILDSSISGIGVRTVPIGEDRQSKLIASAFTSKLGNGGASFMTPGRSGPVESIAFGCYWKSCLTEIGGFDERIVRGQDWDLNLRLRSNGGTLWLHDGLETAYYTRTSHGALWRRQFLAGRWKRYIHQKSSKPFLTRHWIPSAFLVAIGGTTTASIAFPLMIWFSALILLSHLTASIWQMRALGHSWRAAMPFWWALLIIHSGYGAGMISGYLAPIKLSHKTPNT